MNNAIVLHNPGAGDGDHFRTDLTKKIEAAGYSCLYFSTKDDDDWKEHLDLADFGVIAGGDGTIRQVVKELVERNILDKKLPLTILPMGTANNLSKTLEIDPHIPVEELISNWNRSRRRIFDVGVIERGGDLDFFLEGAGYGLFPALMRRMESLPPAEKNKITNAEDEIRIALQQLHKLVLTADAQTYWLQTDTDTRQGKFLLLEVMNIRSIGPNIQLCPAAITDDGLLDVVCVEESQRGEFAAYVEQLLNGQMGPTDVPWKPIRTKKVVIHCDSPYMHLDDELILPSSDPVVLEARENILEFLVK